MPSRKTILECLEISSANETITFDEDFLGDVKKALEESKSVEDRKYELNDFKEDGESQFISDYSIFDRKALKVYTGQNKAKEKK